MYSEKNSLTEDLIKISENDDLIVEFIQGYPGYEKLREIVVKYQPIGSILVMDDSLAYFTDEFARIFFELSHHQNCTPILLTQSLFHQTKSYRTLALNTHNLWLMRNLRDRSQIISLSKQVSPYSPSWIISSYLQATNTPYSYLKFSFHQTTNPITQITARLLPFEPKPIICFVKNDLVP